MRKFLLQLQKSTSGTGESVLQHLDSFSSTSSFRSHAVYRYCQDYFAVGHLFRTIPSSFRGLLSLKIGSLHLPSTVLLAPLREYDETNSADPLSQYTGLEVCSVCNKSDAMALCCEFKHAMLLFI